MIAIIGEALPFTSLTERVKGSGSGFVYSTGDQSGEEGGS